MPRWPVALLDLVREFKQDMLIKVCGGIGSWMICRLLSSQKTASFSHEWPLEVYWFSCIEWLAVAKMGSSLKS
jgi:hypothetical protein